MTRARVFVPETLAALLPSDVAERRINWLEVARTDVANTGRSWLLWALCGLFTVLMLLAPMHPVLFFPTQDSEIPFRWGIEMIRFVTRWFVPLSALLVGAMAVVDEREGGNLRVLLGLPITRRDALIGKFLGRSVVFSSTLLVGLALAGAEIWYFFIDFDLGAYAIFVALTLLLGLTFVGIGVGISALVRSRARATGASVGVFALVSFVWHVLPVGVFYLVDGRYPENVPPPWEPPAWFVFLGNSNPATGYLAIFEEWAPGVYSESMELTRGTFEYRQHVVEGAGPFYLQPEFLLVVLVLWGVVPLVIGAWRFGRSDLG